MFNPLLPYIKPACCFLQREADTGHTASTERPGPRQSCSPQHPNIGSRGVRNPGRLLSAQLGPCGACNFTRESTIQQNKRRSPTGQKAGHARGPAPASYGVCRLLVQAGPRQECRQHRRCSITAPRGPEGISLIEFHRMQPWQMALHHS